MRRIQRIPTFCATGCGPQGDKGVDIELCTKPFYAGYCPQLKYNMGRTYGQLTAKLLTSPDVPRSTRLVLHAGRLATNDGPDWTSDEMLGTTRMHREEHSNVDTMIPGYTGVLTWGFIPKRQKYFAQTYAQTCRGALTEFNRDQHTRVHLQTSELPVVSYRNPEFQVKKLNTPLTATCSELTPLKASDAWTALGSPYLMDERSPHKYFISGFTGYVPKSRFLIGRSYPATTNEALIQFGRELQCKFSSSADNLLRESSTLPPVSVSPSTRGQGPFYTGHGYGDTFGKLTHSALGVSNVKRSIEGKS
ncbi:Protein FAM166B [Merluccius polli]|uniref:Ciliary microtubule inner protein 2B n=1 Tax=Merluccius polli TaxID=89951 RepID=A0AA47P6D6_MERPO|nr:Protein FAM166B [Merluccius polli]